MRRCLSLEPEDVRARGLLATVLRLRGRREEASREAEEALGRDPLDFLAARERWMATGKEVDRERFRRLMKDVHSYLELATYYESAGLWEEAVSVLREAPGGAMVHYHIGLCLRMMGRDPGRSYRKAGEAPPDYVFPHGLEDMRALEVALEVKEFLLDQKHCGKPIFKEVYLKEEIYSGKYTGNAPDVVLLPREGYEIICGFAKPLWVFKVKQSGWDGIHNLNGIFLAYGKCIKKGVKIERVKIYDVAPTILHIFGLPIPDDIDGRVLMEIFEENSEISKRQPIYVRPSYYDRRNEKELLKSKIRKLKQEGKI